MSKFGASAATRHAPRLLLALALLAASLVAPAAAANDRAPISLTRFGSAVAFSSGTFDSVQLQDEALALTPGSRSGAWVSPPIEPGFGMTRIVPSWNAETPGGSHIRVHLQAVTTESETSDWYALGVWASDDHTVQRSSLRGQSDALGRVETDTLVARNGTFGSYSLRVTLERPTPEDPSPRVRMLAAQASNTTFDPAASVSEPGLRTGVELAVPAYSQEIHANEYPQWGGGGEVWCSPTSTQMVIEYWGRAPSPEQLAWVNPAYADPSVDLAARGTYDVAYRGTGNWSFNAAYAAGYGLDAFVTQLRSLAEAELFIRGEIPLVASIASRPRELTGFLFDGGTNGHLVVIVGFDSTGNPIVNDPAAWSNATVRRVYDRAQFERVWLRGSGGTVYVIRPPEIPVAGHACRRDRKLVKARLAAIARQRCPRCLQGRVFRRGGWLQLRMFHACPECRVIYGRESGYFTGAMIVSYILGVPLLAAISLIVWWLAGWRVEIVLLVAGVYFLAFVPAIFRYSRVIWMHFDRVVDPDPTSERYAAPIRRSPQN